MSTCTDDLARSLSRTSRALTLGAATLVLIACSSTGPVGPSTTPATTAPVATTTTATTTTPAPASTTATPTASATSSTMPSRPGAARAALAIYVSGEQGGRGPRLYREFHSLVPTPDRVTAALTEMFRGRPLDPDYRSLWPTTTTVRSISRSGAVATVDLSGWVGGLGAAYESTAVQQLVYTATAADPTLRSVLLRVRGAVPPSGHLLLDTPVRRGPALETQANVWILAPTQGATTGSPVTVRVLGTGYEGNVPLAVYAGTRRVAMTAVTTMMGGFAQAQTTFTLRPGRYEVRAFNDNGKDATLQLWDTKVFTVR